jgi:nucleotidyltransferase substrate binding protein (TIGR01987 family)
MENQDIRWKQRFYNYEKALLMLKNFLEVDELNIREEQGLIQCFEYTYELAWNVMKDYFEFQAEEGINGSRDAIKLSFKRNLIDDGEGWMDMIKSRIKSSHTYNNEIANEIVEKILNKYYKLFNDFEQKMKTLL